MIKIATYKTPKGVHSAVKRLAMHLMSYTVHYRDEVMNRGFIAVME